MPYTPTEWKTGDVVTAQKLNKIEAGISESGSGSGSSDLFIINFALSIEDIGNKDQMTSSTEVTPRQVIEAVQNNKTILLRAADPITTEGTTVIGYYEFVPLISLQYNDNDCMVAIVATAQIEIGVKIFVSFQGHALDTPFEVTIMTVMDNSSGG